MKTSNAFLISLCFASAIASAVYGQSRGTTSMTDSKRIISTDTLREMTKADSDNAIPRAGSRSTNAAIVKELKDDFRSLQQINNAMMGHVWGTTEVNYAKVSGMISDINKRAGRLKKNLALPESNTRDDLEFHPTITSAKELKANLLLMDKAISEFVNTPLLRKPDVISTDAAQQASTALNRVISMSAAVARAAARLKNPNRH
jgi:hypothetical protein